jgi:hypothetical protein
MSVFIVPFIITLSLALTALLARMVMNRLHVQLLAIELGNRSYDHLSELERNQLNEAVNYRFSHSYGNSLATFVLLYAYPTLFVSQNLFGRTTWKTREVIGWSSLFYYSVLVSFGMALQNLNA